MKVKIPDISKQIYKEDILGVMESRYSTLGSAWVSHQMSWLNGIYSSYKDHNKFLIVIFLIKKTLDFYSRNFTKLPYEEFYLKDTVEIEKFTVAEISRLLDIPKETTRRKLLELENEDAIKEIKKKLILDRSKFFKSKPIESIKRISRFLSMLSEMCVEEKILSNKISSKELELVIKDNFSYIWKIYYEVQIPMLIGYKKIFKDIETFHIFGVCVVNEHIYARKISESHMNRDKFLKSIFTVNKVQGINAMSISDITSIPRATVIRKLKKLVNQKILTINDKKHYKLTGSFANKLKPLQKNVFVKLADFSTKVFNLVVLSKN